MQLHCTSVSLPLSHPFTISRGTVTTRKSVYVQLSHDGLTGLGEVSENQYYGHTFQSIQASLRKVESLLPLYATANPADVWDTFAAALSDDMFALSALDMAAHDLYGQRLGLPTWQAWGLTWRTPPCSSFTIGIAEIPTMLAKLDEQPGWEIYKIKLGTEHDLEIMSAITAHSPAKFRVDANGGWTPDQAIEYSQTLAGMNVEFIEQPLPVTASAEDKRRVYEASELPIIADEDCQVIADVQRCATLYHGVNVKLAKCGGMTAGLRMLREAHDLGLRKMLGCMIESSIGISGAAQLLPLLDYADLDGAVLLKDHPTVGVTINQGDIQMVDAPGTGARLLTQRLPQFTD